MQSLPTVGLSLWAVLLTSTQSKSQDHIGFTMASPMVVTASGSTAMLFKGAGYSKFASIASRGGGQPDFAAVPPLSIGAEVVSMSIGMETINVQWPNGNTSEAFPIVDPDHGWVELAFTANGDEVGTTAIDGVVETEHERGELDGGLFSFLMPGSSLELLSDEDAATLALSASTTGLDAERILAVDFHMALYGLDPEFLTSSSLTRALPTEPNFYFTLAQPIPAAAECWYRGSGCLEPSSNVSSATILRTTWDAASRAWSTPSVWKLWSEIDGVAQSATIDGLAVDDDGDPNSDQVRLLFSLDDSVATDDQLLYARVGERVSASGAMRTRRYSVLHNGATTTVTARTGARRSLGGFCVRDPIGFQVPGPRIIDEFAIARRDPVDPMGPLASLPVDLACSGYRGWRRLLLLRTGRPTFATFMSGPKTNGTAVVEFFLQVFDNDPAVLDWVDQPGIWSTRQSVRYRGRPVSVEILIPRVIRPCSSTSLSPPAQPYQMYGCERLVAQWSLVQDGIATHVAPRCVILK